MLILEYLLFLRRQFCYTTKILLFMEILKVYFQSVPESAVEVHEFAISSSYCKPKILMSLGNWFLKESNGLCLFICCSKYGCRQFLPKFHSSFPVHNVDFISYKKKDLPWLLIEFNDNAVPFIKK